MNRFQKAAVALALFAAAYAAATEFGSPHLRIFYSTMECRYFGLNGWELDGTGATCPLVKVFPWG